MAYLFPTNGERRGFQRCCPGGLCTHVSEPKPVQGRSRYSTWVHGIAVNTSLTLRRSRSRRSRRESKVAAEASQSASTVAEDPARKWRSICADVGDFGRNRPSLADLEVCRRTELRGASGAFGLSVSACKMRVSRARDKLQQRFPEHHFVTHEA